MQTRTIRQNALLKFSSELVGRLALFSLVILAARRLGETGFGLYNYALAIGFVLAQLADLGMQLVITREIASDSYRQSNQEKARSLVLTSLQLKLILSVVVTGLIWALTARQANGNHAALFLLGLLPLLQSFPEFTGYVYRGRQNLMVEARLLAAARVALAIAGVTVLLANGGLLGLSISQAVVGLVFAFWGLWLLRNDGWISSLDSLWKWQHLNMNRDEVRFILRQSLPLGVSIFLSIAYVRMAVLLLQNVAGEEAVAQFSAASRLIEPAQLVPASLMAAVFPAFTLALRQNPGAARGMGGRTTLSLLAISVLLAIGGWLVAPVLLPLLYGPAYSESVRIFQVMAISLVPAFVNYSLTHYLVAQGQQLLMGIFTGAMLVLHAGLSWFLIPRLGAVGPALSIILAELLLTTLCAIALFAGRAKSHHDSTAAPHVP